MSETTQPDALRVLIVDDEALARLRMRALVQDCPWPPVEVLGEAGSAAQAMARLQSGPCDLLLLDVAMPGLDGVGFAAQVRKLEQPPSVVFVTAHAEHALVAFELDAVDYLTKPVKRDRLQAALERCWERHQLRRGVVPVQPAQLDEAVIVVADRGRVIRVPVVDVLYLKADQKYVTLRIAEASYLIDDSLAELEARWPDRFLRIHRNALVARRALRALERRVMASVTDDDVPAAETWAVRVAPVDEWLAVSRRQVAVVRDVLAAAD